MKLSLVKTIVILVLATVSCISSCKKKDLSGTVIVVKTIGEEYGLMESLPVRPKSNSNKTSFVSTPKGYCSGYIGYSYAFVSAGVPDNKINEFKETVRVFLQQELNLSLPGDFTVPVAPQPIFFSDAPDPDSYLDVKSCLKYAFSRASYALGLELRLNEGSVKVYYPFNLICGQAPPVVNPTDPSNPGGGGAVPSPQAMGDVLQDNLFAFIKDAPCEVVKAWLATARFIPDASIIGKLNTVISNELAVGPQGTSFNYQNLANIQSIDDATSTVVNMDYFPVRINQLPIVNGQRLTKAQFLHYVRVNINSFTSPGMFLPYNNYTIDDRDKWNSSNPKGAIIKIDIPGPDNASVITSYSAVDRWTFTTIHEPRYGAHPVSGNRDFGITTNSDGSYTFYVRGVDRLTSWQEVFAQAATGIPFILADKMWTDFQQSLENFIVNNGGSASVIAPEIQRPDWEMVKKVMQGILPLSAISKRCPD